MRAVIVNKWVICGDCGAKLIKIVSNNSILQGVEIKCRQCHTINTIDFDNSGNKAEEHNE